MCVCRGRGDSGVTPPIEKMQGLVQIAEAANLCVWSAPSREPEGGLRKEHPRFHELLTGTNHCQREGKRRL